MHFDEYLHNLKQREHNNGQEFSHFMLSAIRKDVCAAAEKAYTEMRDSLAHQLLSNPQNSTYDYKVRLDIDLPTISQANIFGCGCPWDSEALRKHGVYHSDGDYSIPLIQMSNGRFEKGKYYSIYFDHLAELAKTDGLHVSDCCCQKFRIRNAGWNNEKKEFLGYVTLENSHTDQRRSFHGIFATYGTDYIPVFTLSYPK